MRMLSVFLNSQKVGTLAEGDDLWRFDYEAEWAAGADTFDLAPGLPRAMLAHQDGGSIRPVQWYFDNLLPEESLRETVSKEAGIKGDDAFALLTYLGAESAGSLVLLPPDIPPPVQQGLKPLPDEELSARIRNLPRASLSSGAPKRMSVAGAQNKLLVVLQGEELFEPIGGTASTHILKPNHTSDDYPSSVINEYLMMRLARAAGLEVPEVHRRYVPEPVYIIERFDRFPGSDGTTQRRHIIDACQLLNKSRSFKNQAATLEALTACIALCRNRAVARLRLYRWLVFNVLIANDDNHLKNVSFTTNGEGIALSPAYDMLSTSTYRTTAFAEDRATWPDVEMMIPLPGASRFGQVTREVIVQAGGVLGLPRNICERELDLMMRAIASELPKLVAEVEKQNEAYPDSVRSFLGGELRVARAIQHIAVAGMLGQVRTKI